ncbi:MAG TPA: thiamine pyrophosphate-dependent enzyme [Gemmatimonadaceae bacterium]|jgi:phosphonopyruvate decarboxylase|nr:thiamine pyrophosphate-dependent enzyme [Gemmatimonadaceae bacterium]
MTGANAQAERMPLVDALRALHDVRGETDVVITTMSSAREWMRLSDPHPLDVVLVPSSMGHGTSMGLGLAIARPDRRVITCMGDGSMLMNLGSLVSIVAAGVENLVVIVFDNGVYEVTGLQPTAGASVARAGRRPVDFADIARASGFEAVHRPRDLDEWRRDARRLLGARGPTFIALDVEPVVGGTAPHSPGSAAERARRFMAALGTA